MEIPRNEVLRYLGCSGRPADDATMKLVEECTGEINEILQKRYVYKLFELVRANGQLRLGQSVICLLGRDIKQHLKRSVHCAVMAVSLGLEVDKRISFYSKVNLSKAIVMDACASAAVEALADQIEKEIGRDAADQGFYLTSRYSPGYGDFPLEHQDGLVRLLDAYREMGLSVTSNSLLLPRKSVTALIGLQPEAAPDSNCSQSCQNCNQYQCAFRKEG